MALKSLNNFTLVIPFYVNSLMLREQIRIWNDYPASISVVLVDDGSPEPALPIVKELASPKLCERLAVYRIDVDIPWNRGGARNLGTKEASTEWVVHCDIDHVLLPEPARELLKFRPDPKKWYRFHRYRRGKADETRQKDSLPPDCEYGEIKPHIDSYLCTKDLYWAAGGYNEDFSGCLGGGSPFLSYLERSGGFPSLTPSPAYLEVYTRDVVKDASDHTLSRERGEFGRRKMKMKGNYKGHDPIRFPWTRCL